jgi:excisionase family DNA binding protein
MESLLTVEESAEKLGLHPETLRKWLREKRIGGVKFGRKWKLRESDLRAFVAANAIPANYEAKP